MNSNKDELRTEYSSSLMKPGVRGKYAKQYAKASNVVVIDSDLHDAFPSAEAVNRALREYLAQKRQFHD